MNQNQPDDPGRRVIVGGLSALVLTTGCGRLLGFGYHPSVRHDQSFVDSLQRLREVEHNYTMPTEEEVNETNICRLILEYEHRFARNGAISSARTGEQLTEATDRFNMISEEFGECYNTSSVQEALAGRGTFAREDMPNYRHRLLVARMMVIANLSQMHATMRRHFASYEPTIHVSDILVRENPDVPENYDCDTYSAIVLGCAEEHDLPFRGVLSPNHLFTRFECEWYSINYDQGGNRVSDEEYIDGSFSRRARRTPQQSIDQGVYLRSINLETEKTRIVGDYLSTIAASLIEKNEFAAALNLSSLATNWAPHNPRAHYIKAGALLFLGYYTNCREEISTVRQLDPEFPLPRYLFNQIERGERLSELGLEIRRTE